MSRYNVNDADFKEYANKVIEYKKRFANLDDKDYALDDGSSSIEIFFDNDFGDIQEPPCEKKKDFSVFYDLTDDEAKIKQIVSEQLDYILDYIMTEKKNHYSSTCTRYIKNSKGRVVNPIELFIRWDKYLLIYTKYKSCGNDKELKANMQEFLKLQKFSSLSDLKNYAKFIEKLVVAANRTDSSFFKQAEKKYTEGKYRQPIIGKRIKNNQ